MKKTVQRTSKFKTFWGMFALVLVLGAGLFAENLAFVSHAESAAKVTASSAKIRKSADSSSEVIGSAAKDKTISIKSQTKGADGSVLQYNGQSEYLRSLWCLPWKKV